MIEEAFRADGHELRTSGGQFVCLCPFHQERTPSCYVTPDTGRFKCFGACGAGGTVIDYQALKRGISPSDAIKELASCLNISAEARVNDAEPAKRAPKTADTCRALPRLPVLEKCEAAELRSLAISRNVSFEAVQMASDRGLLHFCRLTDGPVLVRSWVLCDQTRRNAQARRLDGRRWQHRWDPDAKDWIVVDPQQQKKVRGFRGNQAAWPVGIEEARDYPAIAIVEGVDLLAAFHFIHAEEREDHVAPVAILGAGNRIPEDAIKLFAGKRVRIFMHLDANHAGLRAAATWQEQVETIADQVDGVDFTGAIQSNGNPIKDLNDCTSIGADSFESQRALWSMMTF